MLHFHIHVVIHFSLKRNWHEISLVLLIVLVSLIKTLNKSWYYQQQQQSPKSSHSPDPQFWEWALNFGKVVVPKKKANFEGGKIFCARPKKSNLRKWICHVLFAKEMKKICQIWPRETLKHFTAAYRGLPPCTQSQHPINRETGYSNVLGGRRPPSVVNDY